MTPEQLEAIGGTSWSKEGKRRVYFNRLSDFLPKRWSEWPGATFTGPDDPKIAEVKARMADKATRLWFDVNRNEFAQAGLTAAEFAFAVQSIIAATQGA